VSEPALATSVAASLAVVRARIARAAARSGRPPSAIRLVAVSKTFGPDHVRAAFAAGQHDFGENRVQEALLKIGQTSDLPVRWHLIGHLQSNKARRAVGPFASIQSVDRVELLQRLDELAAEHAAPLEVLVQVDLAGEETKFGATIEQLDRIFSVASAARAVLVTGLMVLPPLFDDPETTRPYFRRLRMLRDELAERGVPGGMLRELSMGMSHDFEVAIEEGATIVRIGTAVFGPRS
jgi:pyridoxal phosphate enzyme (YggS family)